MTRERNVESKMAYPYLGIWDSHLWWLWKMALAYIINDKISACKIPTFCQLKFYSSLVQKSSILWKIVKTWSVSLAFAGAPKMLDWNSRGFTYPLAFLLALKNFLIKVSSFLPLFPLSVAADIHIKLASENPLTQLRFWDMESSPCPSSLSINPSEERTPGGWILKFKGRAKNNLTSRLCFHFGSHVHLNGKWQVVLITFLSFCLPEALSANLARSLALCPCINVLLGNAWPSLIPSLSTSHWNLLDCFFYLGIQGITQQNEKPVVITEASMVSHCWLELGTEETGGDGDFCCC